MNRFTLLICIFLSAAPLVAESLEWAGAFSDVIDVEVVGLEVYVSGGDGQPLKGLRAGDFELQANGAPVEITHFHVVEEGRRVSGAVPGPADPLFLVLFIDNVHLSAFGRNRLLAQLRPFLEARMKGGDQVMLVTDGGHVDLRQPFTREWRKIRQGLEELGNDPGFGHIREREHSAVIENILSLSDLHDNLPMENLRTRCPRELESLARGYAREVYGRVRSTTQRLGDFIDTLGSLPGRKALLHVSDGLHLLPGSEVYEHLCQLCGNCPRDGAEAAAHTSTPPLTYDGSTAPMDGLAVEAAGVFRQLTRRANANRVTLFTLEAYGSRTTSDAVERSRIASLRDSLAGLAKRTGGRAILDTLDFEPALTRISEDFDTYYSLGYRLPRTEKNRDLQVQVVMHRQDAQARYRQTLHTRPLTEQLADHTRATLMYGVSDNPLSIMLEIGQPEALDKSLNMVPVRVRVPLDKVTLLAEKGETRGHLTLFLAARDRSGRIAPARTADIPIRIPEAEAETAGHQPFLYEVRMLMRQGDHTLAVGVRDELGRQASYLIQDVQISGR